MTYGAPMISGARPAYGATYGAPTYGTTTYAPQASYASALCPYSVGKPTLYEL